MIASVIEDHIFLFTTVVLISSLWVLLSWNRYGKRKLRLPPGPTGWPIVKNLPLLFQHPGSSNDDYYYSRLAKEFGEIYKLEFGSQLLYVLTNPNHVKQVFSHNKIQGRPPGGNEDSSGPGAKGFILTDGPHWKAMKRLVNHAFRDLGVGKGMFEGNIQDEINRFTAKVDTLTGEPCCDIYNLCKTATCNIISGILFGRQYDYEDTKGEEMRQLMNSLSEAIGPAGIAFTNKLVRRLPFGPGKTFRDIISRLTEFIKIEIEHAKKETGNNFAKSFCLELEKDKSYFTQWNLVQCCIDMFFAGTETPSSALAFLILYLTCCPEAQLRCQRELREFIQINGMPTYYDRSKLPYIQATIQESYRLSIVSPNGAPHLVEEDLQIFGYDFPKGTLVIANYGSLFMDPHEFHEPRNFNPDRFIGNGQFKAHSNIIPFGTGSRTCAGEPLERMKIFLFLTRLLHRYTFSAPTDMKMPDVTEAVYHGGSRMPPPFSVVITRRETGNSTS